MSASSIKLDDQLHSLLLGIEHAYATLPKSARIRVERWVERLSLPTTNMAWKRNTNAHAELLLAMVEDGAFAPPFDSLPPHDTEHGGLENLTARARAVRAQRQRSQRQRAQREEARAGGRSAQQRQCDAESRRRAFWQARHEQVHLSAGGAGNSGADGSSGDGGRGSNRRSASGAFTPASVASSAGSRDSSRPGSVAERSQATHAKVGHDEMVPLYGHGHGRSAPCSLGRMANGFAPLGQHPSMPPPPPPRFEPVTVPLQPPAQTLSQQQQQQQRKPSPFSHPHPEPATAQAWQAAAHASSSAMRHGSSADGEWPASVSADAAWAAYGAYQEQQPLPQPQPSDSVASPYLSKLVRMSKRLEELGTAFERERIARMSLERRLQEAALLSAGQRDTIGTLEGALTDARRLHSRDVARLRESQAAEVALMRREAARDDELMHETHALAAPGSPPPTARKTTPNQDYELGGAATAWPSAPATTRAEATPKGDEEFLQYLDTFTAESKNLAESCF